MDTKEIYLKKIDEFIEKYKDESKIASINTYLKGNAKIIYGIPMKKFKALFGKYINEFANLNNDDLFNIINSLFLSLAFEKQVAACMLLENNVEKLNIDLPNLFQEYIENNIIINWAVADQTALNILSKLNNLSFTYDYACHDWAIRNIYNYNEKIYFDFLNDYAHKLPRIMLRNAIEMLEEDIRMNILVTSKEKRDGLK